jgi:hypothetical protein
VVRGARKPNALSSLENNIIVTEILDAARVRAHAHPGRARRARR